MANNPQNPGSQETIDVPNVTNQETSSDWQEYTASDGRIYFYNKRRKVSSWDKPLELMTPLEKVDSSTVWKVYTTAEGKKYYYNKETKECTWTIPEELKLVREQAEKEASRRSQSGMVPNTHTPTTVTPCTLEPSLTSIPMATITHKARGRNQPTVPPVDLPPNAWLRFPNTVNPSYLHDLNNKLKKHMRRDIEVPHSLDWDLADQTGLSAAMEDLLVQKYRNKDDEVLFICHAWRNLFHIRESIYRELVLEFHSTIWFNHVSTDYNDRRVFTFRLGGKSRQCSLRELSWRLGLYTFEETKSIHFLPFLEDAATLVLETEFQVEEFWAAIANGEYDSRIAVEGRIRSPIHRLLHRLIATSLSHRRGSGMVSTFDLYYLWCLLTPDVHLNIPWTIALYLAQKAIETHKTSPICGGHFVTRLALSYGILTSENMDQLVRYEPMTIDISFLEDMRVLRMEQDGIARIVGIDAVEQQEGSMEDESTQLTRPTKRRRLMDFMFLSGRVDGLGRAVRQLRHTVAGLGLYQDDIRQYQFGLQDQIQWIGTAMSSLLTQHGLTIQSPFPAPPPKYPSWGMRFPTHTPPRDDGAGPSDTYQS